MPKPEKCDASQMPVFTIPGRNAFQDRLRFLLSLLLLIEVCQRIQGVNHLRICRPGLLPARFRPVEFSLLLVLRPGIHQNHRILRETGQRFFKNAAGFAPSARLLVGGEQRDVGHGLRRFRTELGFTGLYRLFPPVPNRTAAESTAAAFYNSVSPLE